MLFLKSLRGVVRGSARFGLWTDLDWPGLDSFWDTDASHYGLTGSPTQVERIFPPKKDTQKETWREGDLAATLHDILKKRKFI